MSTGRNTTTRDRHRTIIARDQPPCYHCSEPIDYQADHRHPLAFEVDHVTPLALGGPDTLDNCVPSHLKCNRSKGKSAPDWRPGVTFTTERRWTT